ncbi:tetraspanin-3-like isoform X2 [Pseudophryne corroboree]|uniref:tetraspanin-3-like isoform X2 n=1 Tax=Pseudophryne corroboree TaxID=495146 RepID=UPI0030817FDE
MGRYTDRTARMCIGFLAFLFWASGAALLYAVYFIILLYKNYKPFFLDFYILLPSIFAVSGAFFLVVNGLLGFKISKKGSRCQQGMASGAALLYAVYFIILLYKNYKPFFLDFYILLPSIFAVSGAFFLVVNGLLGFKISKKGSRCQQGMASGAALLYAVYFIILLYKNYKPFFLDFYILLPSIFAVSGAFFLVVNGLLGFKISKKGSRCQQGMLDHELRPMQNAFHQYNDTSNGITVNKIQNELHCCGLHNYSDWEATSWYKHSGNHSVPKSCCNVAFSSCSGNITESNKLYQEGCLIKLHHRLTFFLIWLFWSGITIISVEVLAAVFDGILMTRNPFQDFRILDSGVFA